MSSWVGNPGRPPYVIPCGSAGLKKNNVAKKLRSKSWALAKLRKAGMVTDGLVQAYKGLVCPGAEYVSPVWHSGLSAYQAAYIERQQTQALQNIFGFGRSAKKLRDLADIELLSIRRQRACLNFAKKNIENKRCQGWFIERRRPLYARRTSATYPVYQEVRARTHQKTF